MKKTIRDNYRIELSPDTFGHRRNIVDDHDAMRGLLADIERAVRRHVDGVHQVLPRWDSRDVCSHCNCGWEVLTAADVAKGGYAVIDEHSVEGEPVCCDKAIAEFRTERGITVHAEGVVAYRRPDRQGETLCRKHGYPWFAEPLTSDDLPDGGICTYARGGQGECGRDVLAVEAGESA